MTADLTKEEREEYEKCLGQCTTCSFNGVCDLQKKIKDGNLELRKLETAKEELEANLNPSPVRPPKEFLKWWSNARDILSNISLEDRMKAKEGWKNALRWVQKLIADGYSADEIKRLIRKELRGE